MVFNVESSQHGNSGDELMHRHPFMVLSSALAMAEFVSWKIHPHSKAGSGRQGYSSLHSTCHDDCSRIRFWYPVLEPRQA
jgi:hypothetical protein